jgi:hypothetical protein
MPWKVMIGHRFKTWFGASQNLATWKQSRLHNKFLRQDPVFGRAFDHYVGVWKSDNPPTSWPLTPHLATPSITNSANMGIGGKQWFRHNHSLLNETLVLSANITVFNRAHTGPILTRLMGACTMEQKACLHDFKYMALPLTRHKDFLLCGYS